MSYQFEDESALEELLNQQLERKRSQSAKPTPPITRQVNTSFMVGSQQRPSTASTLVNPQVQAPVPQDQRPRPTTAGKTTGKLASWLQVSADVPSGDSVATSSITNVPPVVEKHQVEVEWREDQLQEMSKQRLIKLILNELLPKLHRPVQPTPQEIDKIREAAKLEANEEAEVGWREVKEQLEARLVAKEDELCKINDRHKTQLSRVESDHKEELKILSQNYAHRLEEERQEFERQLARRDEFHRLELDSKLKVDCDLKKMDAIFKEWDRRARLTVEDLERQFSRVESLLERQALEVNGTNERLAIKNGLLSEQLGRFERDKGELTEIAKELGECLPRFVQSQLENESLNKEISSQLQDLAQRTNQVRENEIELAKVREKLMEKRQQVQEERHRCALEANKIEHLEARLGQLVESNQVLEADLRRRLGEFEEREREQQSLRQQLDVKGAQLKRQNYELHQDRAALGKRRQELTKWARELEDEREAQRQQANRLASDSERLGKMRAKARRELEQLNRVQRSLVCSICSSSLIKLAPGEPNEGSNKWRQLEGNERGSRYEQLETRRLAAESEYVELLKRSTVGG